MTLLFIGVAGHFFLKGYLYPLAIKTAKHLVTKRTGGKIDIGAVELGFFPASLDLKNIVFSYSQEGNVHFKVKEISATLNMIQAFSGAITINRLHFLEPEVSLSADQDFLKSFARTETDDGVNKPSFFSLDVRTLTIEKGGLSVALTGKGGLELKDISFNYTALATDEANLTLRAERAGISYNNIREELERVEIEGSLSKEVLKLRHIKGLVAGKFVSGNLEIDLAGQNGVKGSLSGQLPLKRLSQYSGMRTKISGAVGFSSRFSYDNDGLKVKADVGMSKGSAEGVSVKDLKARLVFEQGVLSIDELSLRFFEGVGVAKGRFDLNAGEYDLSAHFSDLRFPAFSGKRGGLLPGGRVGGNLRGKGNFKTPSFDGVFLTEVRPLVESGKGEVEHPLTVEGVVTMAGKEIKIEKGMIQGDGVHGDVAGTIRLGGNLSVEMNLDAGDLSPFAPLLGAGLAGSAVLNGRLYGSLKQPSLDLRLNLNDARYAGYEAKVFRGLVRWVSPILTLHDIEILGEESHVGVSGKVDFLSGTPDADIVVHVRRGELGELLSMAGKDFPLKGNLKGRLHLKRGKSTPLNISASLDLRRGNLYGEPFDRISLKGTYENDRLDFERLDARKGRAYLKGEGILSLKGPLRMTVTLENVDLKKIKMLRSRLEGIEGTINFNGRLEGTSGFPRLRGDVAADRLGWDSSNISVDMACSLDANINGKKPKSSSLKLDVSRLDATVLGNSYATVSPFLLSYDDERVSLKDFVAEGPRGTLSAAGRLEKGGALHFDLDGDIEVGGIERKFKALEMIKGTVNLKAAIGGNLKKPEINAALMTEGGMVRFVGFPYDMTSVKGKVSMTPGLLTIEDLSGELQGALLTGGGEVAFERLRPKSLNLFFDVQEVDLIYPEWFPSRSKGRITLSGSREELTLGGDIEVIRASYTESVEIKKMIAKAIEAGKRQGGGEAAEGGLNINMHFRADDNIIVKNNIADIELKGNLNLIGTTSRLGLLGELETIGGKTNFRNRPFSLVKGTVSFSDREAIIPRFDVSADTDIKDYHVNLNVSGTPEKYTVALSSDPPLDDNELAALVTFGYTRGDTEMTSIGAASLLLQEELEGKVKKYFGFDRFQIDPYYSESSGSTEARVTVGKELQKNVSASYSRGVSSAQEEEVKLEYRFDDNVSVEGSWASTEETIGAFGGDLIYRFEFQ